MTVDGSNAHGSILVVDDDELVRQTMASMLTDAGYTVTQAEDGSAALDDLLAGRAVDLVITDINMPRMDGLALARHVRRRWPGLPVLLVSGRPQPAGTQPYMAKPFRWTALIEAVGRLAKPAGERATAPTPV